MKLSKSQKIKLAKLSKYGVTEEQILNPPKCKICNNIIGWNSSKKTWKIYCSKRCMGKDADFQIYRNNKVMESNINKYGVHNWKKTENGKQSSVNMWKKRTDIQKKNIQQQKEISYMNNYGVINPMQDEIIANKQQLSNILTLNKLYGVSHNMHIPETCRISKENREKTMIKKYGVKSSFDIPSVMHKAINASKQTIIKRYGVDSVIKIPGVMDKIMNNKYKRTTYTLPSGRVVLLQGYEPKFLDFVFENNVLDENDIIYKVEPISYYFNNKAHKYYPDFFIPKLNLIIEIKSDYILKIQGIEKQKCKENGCLNKGFKYSLILNNNFNEFIEKYGEK